MPFVPLGSRRRLEVTLDDDKARLSAQQRRRDEAAVVAWAGASAAPVRFGSQSGAGLAGLGAGQQPRPPQGGSSPRRPTAAACDEGAMQRPRSLPSLERAGTLDSAVVWHPVSTELRKLEKQASRTVRVEMQGVEVAPKQAAPPREPERGPLAQGEPILFPKYMLLHNCHLKTRDVLSFHAEQEAARATGALSTDLGWPAAGSALSRSMCFREASWGAPRLRQEGGAAGGCAAGSVLPTGRCHSTSNPYK